MKYLVAVLMLSTSACTFSSGPSWTVGMGKVEECARVVQHPDGKVEKFDCKYLESEGVSSEFTAILATLFRWWPF